MDKRVDDQPTLGVGDDVHSISVGGAEHVVDHAEHDVRPRSSAESRQSMPTGMKHMRVAAQFVRPVVSEGSTTL